VVVEHGPLCVPGITISGPFSSVTSSSIRPQASSESFGMRVERPVLVPLDRGAAARRLGVELAGLQQDIGPSKEVRTPPIRSPVSISQ
jgi:hypothetical protein